MASKRRNKGTGQNSLAPARRSKAVPATRNRTKLYLAIAGGAVALLAVIAIAFVALGGGGSNSAPRTATGELVVQGQGGHWTNVTPDRLAQMLTAKDFTLVNVKTPYIGEIDEKTVTRWVPPVEVRLCER